MPNPIIENPKDINKVSDKQAEKQTQNVKPTKETSVLRHFANRFGHFFRDASIRDASIRDASNKISQNPQQEEEKSTQQIEKNKAPEHPSTTFTTLHR